MIVAEALTTLLPGVGEGLIRTHQPGGQLSRRPAPPNCTSDTWGQKAAFPNAGPSAPRMGGWEGRPCHSWAHGVQKSLKGIPLTTWTKMTNRMDHSYFNHQGRREGRSWLGLLAEGLSGSWSLGEEGVT